MIRYTVSPLPASHQWQVCLTFRQPENATQTLALANWTPGSYMIRDFSRHITAIRAECDGRPAALVQTAKNRWQTPAQAGQYSIFYTVYANDMSVRASLLDTDRGFIDGACLFLSLPDCHNQTHQVSFEKLPENWQIATTLTQTAAQTFQAASYGELIDHPFELGAAIEILEFSARSIPHRIAISGIYPDFDRSRLIEDSRKICETALSIFPQQAPFGEYLFLLHVGDQIYGGLEHRSSTALHIDRHSLPAYGLGEADRVYTGLLGLISHEYFHAWNVKSVKPAAFEPYDLEQESYTEQLWAFEGITAYYDDLILARSGVISPAAYLNLLARTLSHCRQLPGSRVQTLAESSFAAWHKFYKADENSPNAIVSYYQQGSLAALCLDQLIRRNSDNSQSLDTVMRGLYQDWLDSRSGIAEGSWQRRAQEILGQDLAGFFQAALYSTAELPLVEALRHIGVELRWQPEKSGSKGGVVENFPAAAEPAAELGCRFKQQDGHALITHVLNGSAAERSGLMPQDKIIAVDGYVCRDFDHQAADIAGKRHRLHFFRHGVLRETDIVPQAAAAQTAYLKISDRAALESWLAAQAA